MHIVIWTYVLFMNVLFYFKTILNIDLRFDKNLRNIITWFQATTYVYVVTDLRLTITVRNNMENNRLYVRKIPLQRSLDESRF